MGRMWEKNLLSSSYIIGWILKLAATLEKNLATSQDVQQRILLLLSLIPSIHPREVKPSIQTLTRRGREGGEKILHEDISNLVIQNHFTIIIRKNDSSHRAHEPLNAILSERR